MAEYTSNRVIGNREVFIRAHQGDITHTDTHAIVNAANESLLGGGGVDGAIHRAAGPELLEYCRGLNGCPTGQAKITPGFKLKAKWVIHTVGPIWKGGNNREHELLASCYENSMKLADTQSLESIAFPAISCGIYKFPKTEAVDIAINVSLNMLGNSDSIRRIDYVLFDEEMTDLYIEKLSLLGDP